MRIFTSDQHTLVQDDLTTEEIETYAWEAERYVVDKIQRKRRFPVGWAQDADGKPVPDDMDLDLLEMLRRVIARLVEHYAAWHDDDAAVIEQGAQRVELRGRGPRNPTRILAPLNRELTRYDTHKGRGVSYHDRW